MIQLTEVTKRYGSRYAVQGLTITVKQGEILGFLGPNGAGKSTTMRLITGYMPPTSGTIRVAGFDVQEEPYQVKRRIGYLPESPPLYYELTVKEYLNLAAELKGLRSNRVRQDTERVMEEVGITHVGGRLTGNLSKGYRQRVGLAQALLGDPEVLILDEPTVGLDPQQIIEIRQLIRQLAGSRTVILSTHILPEVSMICQRVMIINEGKLVVQDTPQGLVQSLQGRNRLVVQVKGLTDQVIPVLKAVEGVSAVQLDQQPTVEVGRYSLEVSASDTVREQLFWALSRAGFPLLEMTAPSVSLEDVFLQLVTAEAEVQGGVENER